MYKYIIFLLTLIIVSIQIYCIEFSPLPWFDETFFASITHSLLKSNTLVPSICSDALNNKQLLIYGPIYFYITKFSFLTFGFGIWQFRIVNLISSFIAIYLILLIKNQISNQVKSKFDNSFWFMYILLDIYLNFNIQGGRMDMLVLTFALLGIYTFNLAFQKQNSYFYIFSGIAWSFSFLTSPRIFFIAIAFGIALFILFLRKKIRYSDIFMIAIPFIIHYSLWIFYCGGIIEYIKIYSTNLDNVNSSERTLSNFIMGNFFVPTYEIPLLLTFVVFLIYSFKKHLYFFKNFNIFLFITSIIFFYILIKDTGPYSVFILPFIYILLIIFYEKYPNLKWLKFLLLCIGLINITFFTLKTTQIILTSKYRNSELASNFVKKHIPRGSKVIGDELYFYANIKNGNQFQYFNRYGELIIREEKLRKIFKYEYLILSDNLSNEFLKDFLYFKSKSKLVKIAHLKINNNYKFKIIKQNDRNSYSATIYKVNN